LIAAVNGIYFGGFVTGARMRITGAAERMGGGDDPDSFGGAVHAVCDGMTIIPIAI
jgi:hypothetical protein